MDGNTTDNKPREKVKAKGVASLSDVELLQLMIGSGTGQYPVHKIARRTVRLLKHHGSSVDYQQLNAISGLGPARVSQLLAMFELASRYPVDSRRPAFKSDEMKHRQLLKQALVANEVGYITFDGAARLLRQRKLQLGDNTHNSSVRLLCGDALNDKANHLLIGRYTHDRLLIPTLGDLDIARSTANVAKLLNFTTSYIIYNDQDWHSVTKDVSHV